MFLAKIHLSPSFFATGHKTDPDPSLAVRAVHRIDQRHFRRDCPQCSDVGEEELGAHQRGGSFIHTSANGRGLTCVLCDHLHPRQLVFEAAGGNVRRQCSHSAALPREPLGPEYRDLHL